MAGYALPGGGGLVLNKIQNLILGGGVNGYFFVLVVVYNRIIRHILALYHEQSAHENASTFTILCTI